MKSKLALDILLPLLIIMGVLMLFLSSKNHFLKHKTINYLSINTDTIQTKSGEPLYITFLKHSSLILTFKSYIIYVDPLSEYIGDGNFPKASYIFITHEHYDHFDKKAISKLSNLKTIIVLNPNSAKLLGKGLIMMNNDIKSLNKDIFVQAVPAYNITPEHLQFHPKNRDNGYVFTIGGTNVYVSGDTEDIPELSKLKNIDICFLPVNQPYTMTVTQANKAVRTIHPKVFYPYHYSDTPVSQLIKLLHDKPEIKVIIHQMQ